MDICRWHLKSLPFEISIHYNLLVLSPKFTIVSEIQ